jgi:cytochrome P450
MSSQQLELSDDNGYSWLTQLFGLFVFAVCVLILTKPKQAQSIFMTIYEVLRQQKWSSSRMPVFGRQAQPLLGHLSAPYDRTKGSLELFHDAATWALSRDGWAKLYLPVVAVVCSDPREIYRMMGENPQTGQIVRHFEGIERSIPGDNSFVSSNPTLIKAMHPVVPTAVRGLLKSSSPYMANTLTLIEQSISTLGPSTDLAQWLKHLMTNITITSLFGIAPNAITPSFFATCDNLAENMLKAVNFDVFAKIALPPPLEKFLANLYGVAPIDPEATRERLRQGLTDLQNDPLYQQARLQEGSLIKGVVDTLSANNLETLELTEVLGFFFAAIAQTRGALYSSIILMYLYHESEPLKEFWQALYHEVKDHSPETLAELAKTSGTYLNAFIREVLRFIPPSPFYSRVCASSFHTRHGHEVPQGALIFAAVGVALRDTFIFGADASLFNPQRWRDNSLSAETLQNRRKYSTVFARGPQQCPGEDLVLVEMGATLGLLLQKFGGIPALQLKGRNNETIDPATYRHALETYGNFREILRYDQGGLPEMAVSTEIGTSSSLALDLRSTDEAATSGSCPQARRRH